MTKNSPRSSLALLVPLLVSTATVTAGDWTHFAGAANRRPVVSHAPRNLDSVRWIASPLADEEFVSHSSPVVHDGHVFATLRVFVDNIHESDVLAAFDVADGGRVWTAPLPPDALESWSSPVIDARLDAIIAISDRTVAAFRTTDGAALWSTDLPQRVVNASPALSGDLFNAGRPANRLFITDHGPFGWATLYAINVDSFDAAGNPFAPGDIVWTLPIEFLSGATPAYLAGRVYLATTDGVVWSVDARTGAGVWDTPVPGLASFGGVTAYQGSVYAAGYNFSGGQNNSKLVKLNAVTGGLVWTVPCERTDSIPIVIGDGRIILAGGIAGFGSTVKVQSFVDHGSFATLQWDTHTDSGGSLTLGGWTTQPAYSGGYLYVGKPAPPGAGFPPYEELFILDLARTPNSPLFVVDQHNGAGGTPAIDGPCLYSIGDLGLFAFCRTSAPQTRELDGGGPIHENDEYPLIEK
jgi:outer membrane protein assembly factor BamB